MAPYRPPNSHYAHLKVDLYDDEMIQQFMGKYGANFYRYTTLLQVRYIWWNKESKIIEVWGPYESFKNNKPIEFLREQLSEYFKKDV